jgi:hypothetical protein
MERYTTPRTTNDDQQHFSISFFPGGKFANGSKEGWFMKRRMDKAPSLLNGTN